MLRTTRHLAAVSAALTVLAATTIGAQVKDTTRTDNPPRPMVRGGLGANPEMGPGAGGRENRWGGPGGMQRQRPRMGRGRGFAPGAPGWGAGMRRAPGDRPLLRGITLSSEQEKALRSAQAKHLMATKPLMIEMTSARADMQLARLNGDQKALDAATARMTAVRSKMDSLRANRAPGSDLRAVLTPDQQKLFDRNLEAMKNARGPGAGFAPREGMRPRGFRDGAGPGPGRTAPPPRRPGVGTQDDQR